MLLSRVSYLFHARKALKLCNLETRQVHHASLTLCLYTILGSPGGFSACGIRPTKRCTRALGDFDQPSVRIDQLPIGAAQSVGTPTGQLSQATG